MLGYLRLCTEPGIMRLVRATANFLTSVRLHPFLLQQSMESVLPRPYLTMKLFLLRQAPTAIKPLTPSALYEPVIRYLGILIPFGKLALDSEVALPEKR
jgi:hypothetical protein